MSRLHFDAGEFRPIIEAAVEAAIRRLQAEQPTDATGKVLVNKREAADTMSVSQATVDRLRKAGLPCVKLDGRAMFRPESLREWAAKREGGAE